MAQNRFSLFCPSLLLPLFLLLSMLIPRAYSADRLIRVNGDAPVEAKPDYAIVRLNLEARDRLLKRARATHESDIAAVLQIAAKYKIPAEGIAQDFPEIESRADGFQLRRTIQLTVRDLHSYNAMLFELYDSAALTVEEVEFRVDDLRKIRDQARALALQAADDKVRLMADVMKRHVGRAMDVRMESGGGTLIRCRGQSGREEASRLPMMGRTSFQSNPTFSAPR